MTYGKKTTKTTQYRNKYQN